MLLPLTIELRPSRQLGVLLLIMHAGALAATVASVLPWAGQLFLAAAIMTSAWLTMRRLSGPGRVCSLTLRADGLLELERTAGLGGEARVLAQSTVAAWLVALLLRCEGAREALTILPDALDPDDFRALRLWLRWRATLS